MIYLKKFDSQASDETEINVGGGIDISLPNVSYCEDVKDVHYTPYNLVRFYVGDITGTTPQTVHINTDDYTSMPIQVSKSNKWYTYVLPKDKRLYDIEGDSVKKVVVKADINTNMDTIIPTSTIEASFKGSNISNVTNMYGMFSGCYKLTSLDVSSFNTSNVTNMGSVFSSCGGLTSLTLSNFDTSNVTSMYYMFNGCSGLTSLDLRNFNTSNVTNMTNMFWNCGSLESLDLSGWDTSKVTDMHGMFRGCTSLTSIIMVGCNQTTIDNIAAVKPSSASISTE